MSKIFAEERAVESVDLFLTERCNLNCSYCFHPQSNIDLTYEAGCKILDRLKDVNPDHLAITFFGGEPLLKKELLLDLAHYARTLWVERDGKQKVAFNLSTNGTIFDEEFFKEYSKLGGRVQISLDGDKETSEKTRIGINFEEVIENIIKMQIIVPEMHCRMTYTPDTVGRLCQNIMFLHKVGFTNIMHQAAIELPWTKDAIEQYEYQLRQVYGYRRSVLRSGGFLDIHFIDRNLKILNGELKKEDNYCEAGQSHLGILPNGDVHICHRAASARKFKLGNILDDGMPIIRGMFLNLSKTSTGCAVNCQASGSCHACPFMHFQVNGDLGSPVFSYCQLIYIEDKLAKEYLQTEINDRFDRRFNSLLDIVQELTDENEKLKECVQGLLALVKGVV